MQYRNLQSFIEKLESENELLRVKEYFSPELEITEVTERIIKSGINKAILFENTGFDFPVLMNMFGSEKRMSLALEVGSLNDVIKEIDEMTLGLLGPKSGWVDKLKTLPLLKKISGYFPKSSNKKGECQEVIMNNPDLTQLPILKCWPHDGGNFITFPVVHTKDLKTGIRNVGMYRMQVFDGQTTGMHWHLHKNSARHYHDYKEKNMKMPVAVTLGGHPAYTYCATAPLPDQVDEYIFAGFLRKKAVTMVKCLTVDLEVPTDVDFVIEGYIDTTESLKEEGPFGDHTGFYSLTDLYPVFHVTCITHKKNAIYPATIVGIPPQEDGWMGKATERIFLKPIQMTIAPEILDMVMPFEGVFHNIVLVKIKQSYPGQAFKVMSALWGAGQMMFNKFMIVFGEHVDLNSPEACMNEMLNNFNPLENIFFCQGPLDVLDHSSPDFVYGGKMGIDLTPKLASEEKKSKPIFIHEALIQKDNSNVLEINSKLMHFGVLAVQVKDASSMTIKSLHSSLCQSANPYFSGIKVVLYLDVSVLEMDFSTLVWLTASQTDAKNDCWVEEVKNETQAYGVLAMNASRKRSQDGFPRPWPQVVLSNQKTIESVDQKWSRAFNFDLVSSPSLKYKTLSPGDAAVWDKNE